MTDSTIKIRLKEKDGRIHLRALIRHPMETGLRKAALTGILVPAHYINRVIVEANGEVVFHADWSAAVSENPFLYIVFDGSIGDNVKLTWRDNTGKTDTIEKTVDG